MAWLPSSPIDPDKMNATPSRESPALETATSNPESLGQRRYRVRQVFALDKQVNGDHKQASTLCYTVEGERIRGSGNHFAEDG